MCIEGNILHVSGSDSVDKVADEVIELVKTKKPYLGARGSVELTISKYRGPSKLIKAHQAE